MMLLKHMDWMKISAMHAKRMSRECGMLRISQALCADYAAEQCCSAC